MSNHKDCFSRYSASRAALSSPLMQVRPLTWAQPEMPGMSLSTPAAFLNFNTCFSIGKSGRGPIRLMSPINTEKLFCRHHRSPDTHWAELRHGKRLAVFADSRGPVQNGTGGVQFNGNGYNKRHRHDQRQGCQNQHNVEKALHELRKKLVMNNWSHNFNEIAKLKRF